MERVYVFDTTLRDGEQVPGCQLNTIEKIQIAQTLELLGVDIIEAGFPVSSPGDFNSVIEISKAVTWPVICALTRAVEKDIEVAAEALKYAKRKRIHTGIGTSDFHIKHKFNSTREQIVERAVKAVTYARNFVDDVEFYAEDAGRTDNEYLARVVQAVVNAGATVVNIPDTTGYCFPDDYGAKIKYLVDNVDLKGAILATHCHKDRGFDTNINTQHIYSTSRMVSSLMNMPVQPNKAIVGRNAFAHSSGIHQDGVLKNVETYEIIDPKDVGIDDNAIVLTARSGRAALNNRLELLGVKLEPLELDKVYQKFLELADQKKSVNDDDILMLVGKEGRLNRIKINYLQVVCGIGVRDVASIGLNIAGEQFEATATGNGPVDAAIRAVKNIIRREMKIQEFLIQAIDHGSDDIGKVHMQVEYNGIHYYGFSANTDIVAASVEAYVDAVNKFVDN